VGLAITLSIRGQHALVADDHAAAETMHQEALAVAETIDNDYLRAEVLDAATAGDVTGARDRSSASGALHARLLDYEGSAYCLSGLAAVALEQERPAVSARLLGPAAFNAATRGRRPHAHPARPALRTGGHCRADDVRSLPGLGLPAQTSRADCDRPARPVSDGVRHRPPPEFAPCLQLSEYKTPSRGPSLATREMTIV
jgi:hypothetical protein